MNSKKLQNIITQGENEQIEFKRLWKDEHLKTLCAFANTNGGIMLIGIEDDKTIIGITNTVNLLEILPNKITNRIGITANVSIQKVNNKSIVILEIQKMYAPVSYHGKFFARSGSVTAELRTGELTHFLLKKYGKTWDDIPVENFTIDEIDNKTIEKFKILAADRIPAIMHEKNTETLLRKLNLYDGDYLKRAAILLFAKDPQKYFIQSLL